MPISVSFFRQSIYVRSYLKDVRMVGRESYLGEGMIMGLRIHLYWYDGKITLKIYWSKWKVWRQKGGAFGKPSLGQFNSRYWKGG